MFWGKYHEILFDYLDLNKTYSETHTHKDIVMDSMLYTGKYIKKARITDISHGSSSIYNNIIYLSKNRQKPALSGNGPDGIFPE